MKKARDYTIYTLGILFAVLIIIQHNFVYLYFDDYGYASLTYAWDGNTKGMEYGLKEILSFLKFQYFNWGGRIVYFFAEILAFRIGGLKCIQWVQCIIILLINVFSGKIIALTLKCDEKKAICLMNIAYGLYALRTVYDGVYWFTASVLYVWPLLPLLIGLYLLLKYDAKSKLINVFTFICFFFAAFSQEQMAVLTFVAVIGFFVVSKFTNNLYSCKYMVSACIFTIVGACACILAPGNFNRANSQQYSEFYQMSLFGRCISNIDDVMDINFGPYNYIFVIIFSLIVGLYFYTVFKKFIFTAISYAFVLFFIFERIFEYQNNICLIIRVVWAVYFCVLLLVALWKKKRYELFVLVVAGACSQGMMLVSPSISERCHTMFEFILHIVLVYAIMSIYSEKCEKKLVVLINSCIVVVVTIYSCINITYILNGYRNNYEINQINNYKLVEASRNVKADIPVDVINLYKLNDDKFSNIMGYDSLHRFIESWMKNYYELPAETIFRWSELGDTSKYQVVDGNWYDDGWLSDYAVLLFSGKQKTVTFTFNNVAGKENMSITVEYNGVAEKIILPANETIVYSLELQEGESEVKITPSESFKPDNGDERILSVIMNVQY